MQNAVSRQGPGRGVWVITGSGPAAGGLAVAVSGVRLEEFGPGTPAEWNVPPYTAPFPAPRSAMAIK